MTDNAWTAKGREAVGLPLLWVKSNFRKIPPVMANLNFVCIDAKTFQRHCLSFARTAHFKIVCTVQYTGAFSSGARVKSMGLIGR